MTYFTLVTEVSLIEDYKMTVSHQDTQLDTSRLQSSGSWKPFHDPQKFAFDSIKTMRYVISNNSKMAFAVKARL